VLASDYHVFALDRRGSGDSDKPSEGYDFKLLIRDVVLFARNLELDPVILVGHSFGAEVALMTAAEEPNLIRSVVLVDGGFRPKTEDDKHTPASEIEKASREYNPETVYPRVTSPVLLVFARDRAPDAEIVAALKKKGIDYLEETRKAGQRARELADRKLRHKEIKVIENTSHWVQVDQPRALEQAIRQFLMNTGVIPK
jgi:pimeloyl-ACP methyl ester carboxylesterase